MDYLRLHTQIIKIQQRYIKDSFAGNDANIETVFRIGCDNGIWDTFE